MTVTEVPTDLEPEIVHPPIVSRAAWLEARKDLLEKEKELTRQIDAVNAMRRRLPMVKIDRKYSFQGQEGQQSLCDLFKYRRQLIVYHFMFDPEWDKGCPGCTEFVNSLGTLSLLNECDTTFVLISRAPFAKLDAYKKEKGWSFDWYSSFQTDFNYDFHVTLDRNIVPLQYNYRDQQQLDKREGEEPWFTKGETHGVSVFFRLKNDVFHTYSAYARGVERLVASMPFLDSTPYGRQQDFEDSPPGWPQKPTYGG